MKAFGSDSLHQPEKIKSPNFSFLEDKKINFQKWKIYFFTVLFFSLILSSCNDYDESSGNGGVIRTDNSEYHIMVEKRVVNPKDSKILKVEKQLTIKNGQKNTDKCLPNNKLRFIL